MDDGWNEMVRRSSGLCCLSFWQIFMAGFDAAGSTFAICHCPPSVAKKKIPILWKVSVGLDFGRNKEIVRRSVNELYYAFYKSVLLFAGWFNVYDDVCHGGECPPLSHCADNIPPLISLCPNCFYKPPFV